MSSILSRAICQINHEATNLGEQENVYERIAIHQSFNRGIKASNLSSENTTQRQEMEQQEKKTSSTNF